MFVRPVLPRALAGAALALAAACGDSATTPKLRARNPDLISDTTMVNVSQPCYSAPSLTWYRVGDGSQVSTEITVGQRYRVEAFAAGCTVSAWGTDSAGVLSVTGGTSTRANVQALRLPGTPGVGIWVDAGPDRYRYSVSVHGAQLQITDRAEMNVAATAQLRVVAREYIGSSIIPPSYWPAGPEFSFDQGGIASAQAGASDATGMAITVAGLAGGATVLRTKLLGSTGATSVYVDAPAVSVTVTYPYRMFGIGDTSLYTATARDAAGHTLNKPVTWTTSNPAIATVNSNGLVTGVAQGNVTITATVDGVSGSAGASILACSDCSGTQTPTGP